VPTDRATARAEVARRGLTATAAERVVRVALTQLPVPLVPRATSQLRRFFSEGPWSADDDAALSAAVGPGRDWFEEELDPELALGFGWRAGTFRVEVRYTPADDAEPGREHARSTGLRPRTLGDTFEDTVVLETGSEPAELRFGLGPATGPRITLTRDTAGSDDRVAALFRVCPDLVEVTLASGTLVAKVSDASCWSEVLLPLFDRITAVFVPPRDAPPDRQLERAGRELGELRPDNPRELARIIDATTSPDAAFRRVAFERLDGCDSPAALRPWARGLEDSSRAVRRTTARVLADTRRPETRELLDHALGDADASVRYYAVRGLAGIDGANCAGAVERLRSDPDVRVRLAVDAAVAGLNPP
jgi:hypothetical protein